MTVRELNGGLEFSFEIDNELVDYDDLMSDAEKLIDEIYCALYCAKLDDIYTGGIGISLPKMALNGEYGVNVVENDGYKQCVFYVSVEGDASEAAEFVRQFVK